VVINGVVDRVIACTSSQTSQFTLRNHHTHAENNKGRMKTGVTTLPLSKQPETGDHRSGNLRKDVVLDVFFTLDMEDQGITKATDPPYWHAH
jgi:hypothetical protein